MKAFTLNEGGELVDGIEARDGFIRLGVRPVDHKPVSVPVDPRALVRGGRMLETPGRGALLLVRDQAGPFGSWHFRAAQPIARWDAMVSAGKTANALDRILAEERVRARYPHRQPVGWYEFHRGLVEAPVDGNARPRFDVYGYLEEDASFEIRRRGKLQGTPSVLLVTCRGGAVLVSDPLTEALARCAVEARS